VPLFGLLLVTGHGLSPAPFSPVAILLAAVFTLGAGRCLAAGGLSRRCGAVGVLLTVVMYLTRSSTR
jgi:uncharacterized membrane protein YphA (DoxX/SURF4 family)